MRVYKSKPKNFLYLLYRLVSPIFDPLTFIQGLTGYIWFIRDLIVYKSRDPKARLVNTNLYPRLSDKSTLTPFDAHYFYQQLWVFENVYKKKPNLHTDIASTYEMSGYLSKIVKTEFIDYRPIDAKLKNLTIKKGDILDLKAKSNSLESVSCLHVIEHIGLGRYGDPIDPEGSKKACAGLARVLKKNGFLYFSTPIGRERVCFNAHRVHNPETILKFFKDLKLVSFSVVDDEDNYIENADYKDYLNSNYTCGMFVFTKS